MRVTSPVCDSSTISAPRLSNLSAGGVWSPLIKRSRSPPLSGTRQMSPLSTSGKYRRSSGPTAHALGIASPSAASPAFVNEQPVAVNRDPVGARHLIGNDAHVTVGRPRAYPLVEVFGYIHHATRVIIEIIGTDDRTAPGTDDARLARRRIDRGNLAAEYLCHVQPSVGPDPHPVGSVERRRVHRAADPPSGSRNRLSGGRTSGRYRHSASPPVQASASVADQAVVREVRKEK